MPVIGLIAGAAALGETLTIPDVAGFAIVALGIVATSGGLARRPDAGSAQRSGETVPSDASSR